MILYIRAKVVYHDFEGGFWGLIEQDKNISYLPINMPQQLMIKDKVISCGITLTDEMSIHMWGIPIKIISFETFSA